MHRYNAYVRSGRPIPTRQREDLAWADELMAEGLNHLRSGRTETAEDYFGRARAIVFRLAAEEQQSWWHKWFGEDSAASDLHLDLLRSTSLKKLRT